MEIHPIIKLRQSSVSLLPILCKMYCEEGEEPELCVGENNELFLRCNKGDITLWHGVKYLDQLEGYLKDMIGRMI